MQVRKPCHISSFYLAGYLKKVLCMEAEEFFSAYIKALNSLLRLRLTGTRNRSTPMQACI